MEKFAPDPENDIAQIRQFNSLTKDALGMAKDTVPATREEELSYFEISTAGGYLPYIGKLEGSDELLVAARLRYRKYGSVINLATFAVAQEQRAKGIGTVALRYIVDVAQRDYGASVIKLTSISAATEFYLHNGFRSTNRMPQEMEKQL